MKIDFFGAVDKDKITGKVRSEMPAYYLEAQCRELKETIHDLEMKLANPGLNPASRPVVERQLRENKAKAEEIRNSRPALGPKEKDFLNKHCGDEGELTAEIKASLFDEFDMRKGIASPHEEYKRQKGHCIKIDPHIARAAHIKLDSQGLATRDGAIKALKLGRRNLGLDTNIEKFRVTDRYRER